MALPFLCVSVALATAAPGLAQPLAQPRLDVPFEPTPDHVVLAMLKVANTRPEDIVYDLGSGDGRIVVAAARDFGVKKAVGVDIDPYRIKQGVENAAKAGVANRATFVQASVFDFDFREATVITMYLLPSVNRELRPRLLAEMKPGTRIVSHRFHMGEWEPDETIKVALNGGSEREVYFWVIPAKAEGSWSWRSGSEQYRLDLKQQFQKATGTLRAGNREMQIENARLIGDRLRFEARDGSTVMRFDGKVAGDSLEGAFEGSQNRVAAKRI